MTPVRFWRPSQQGLGGTVATGTEAKGRTGSDSALEILHNMVAFTEMEKLGAWGGGGNRLTRGRGELRVQCPLLTSRCSLGIQEQKWCRSWKAKPGGAEEGLGYKQNSE